MAENISISAIAGSGGVTEYTLVKMSSGKVVAVAADGTDVDVVGIAQNTAAADEALTVVLSGRTLAKAGAAITAGATDLIGTTGGKVTATHPGGGEVCAIVGAFVPRSSGEGAAQDCASGDLIEIQLYGNKQTTRSS